MVSLIMILMPLLILLFIIIVSIYLFGVTFFVFCPGLLNKIASRLWHALTSGPAFLAWTVKVLLSSRDEETISTVHKNISGDNSSSYSFAHLQD